MKKLIILMVCLGFITTASTSFASDGVKWKGTTEVSPYEFGLVTGLGLFGTQTSWSFLATGAYLIQPKGWIDEVDERIWLEIEAGPAFFSAPAGISGTGLQYSVHGRWDFTYDENWTAYGLGGFSGFALPSSLGSAFSFHPRFGVGLQYQTKTPLMFRGEISHEFMGLGVALNF
jgi:hypothetical protein